MTDTPQRKPNRRDAAKARTAQRVLEAAAGLFSAEGGYEAATMRTIAKAAGMSTGAIFANYADKAALYRAIYGHPPISPEKGRELLAAAEAFNAAFDALFAAAFPLYQGAARVDHTALNEAHRLAQAAVQGLRS